jgi:hypothetical protein
MDDFLAKHVTALTLAALGGIALWLGDYAFGSQFDRVVGILAAGFLAGWIAHQNYHSD